jgi:hypothetical protein
MTVAQVQAKQVGVGWLVEWQAVSSRAARFSFLSGPLWITAAAISPVPDGTNGDAANLSVLPV